MEPQKYQCIKVERKGHIGILTVNRPDKRNAIDHQTAVEYCDALQQFNNDKEVRAIVVRAEGDDFGSGEDIFALKTDIQIIWIMFNILQNFI